MLSFCMGQGNDQRLYGHKMYKMCSCQQHWRQHWQHGVLWIVWLHTSNRSTRISTPNVDTRPRTELSREEKLLWRWSIRFLRTVWWKVCNIPCSSIVEKYPGSCITCVSCVLLVDQVYPHRLVCLQGLWRGKGISTCAAYQRVCQHTSSRPFSVGDTNGLVVGCQTGPTHPSENRRV